VRERGRLRDRPFCKRRGKSERLEKRQKILNRKDKKLVNVKRKHLHPPTHPSHYNIST
jgi:hypothetical protein